MDLSSIIWHPPIRMRTYPHLLQADALVWDAWLASLTTPPIRVAYDVHVGTAVPLGPLRTPMTTAIADAVTRKRIDVIADWRDTLWIIELKPYGNHAGVGQVLQYDQLFRLDYRPLLLCMPVLMSFEFDRDLDRLAAAQGVRLIPVRNPHP